MRRKWGFLAGLTLLAAVWFSLGGALRNDFVSFDDPAYVTENPWVLGGVSVEGVRWAFGSFAAGMWHPLTWMSHMLDVELFGVDPSGHHATNVFLHGATALLLFFWLARATRRPLPSLAVAAFFALHPLRVESVAWAAERKDVLSAFLCVLTLLAYDAYARRRSPARYLWVLALFALGLLAKPMLVTLPLALLLLDRWPLGRWRSAEALPPRALLLEKLPLLALAAGASAVALFSQAATPALKSFDSLPLATRLGQSAIAYAAYLRKTVWPADLAVFYPHPWTQLEAGEFAVRALASLLLLTALSVLALRRLRGAARTGWLWFLGMLVPVIGIVQVGGQGMADRYSYLPSIGLWMAICFPLADFLGKRPRLRIPAAALSALLLLGAALGTRAQVETWSGSRALFEQALRVTERNHVAHSSLGLVLLREGDAAGARAQFEEALRIQPRDANAHHNLALLLMELGEFDAAGAHLQEAMVAEPESAEPYAGMGDLLRRAGQVEESVAYYDEAIARAPDYATAHLNRGVALFRLERFDEAAAAARRVLEIDPRNVDALNNLGAIASRQSQSESALDYYGRVLELDPSRTRVRFHVAGLLMELGRWDEAEGEMRRVLMEAPGVPDVQRRAQELQQRRAPGQNAERPGG